MKANKSTDNLCDGCELCFANCPSKNVVFGNGIGDDNVIECDSFIRGVYNNSENEEGMLTVKFNMNRVFELIGDLEYLNDERYLSDDSEWFLNLLREHIIKNGDS